MFNSSGGLSRVAVHSSEKLFDFDTLRNTDLIRELSNRSGNLSDWGKYVTKPFHTSAGLARMHFYHNPVTGDVYYDRDYKVVYDHQGSWNVPAGPKFDYEPRRPGH